MNCQHCGRDHDGEPGEPIVTVQFYADLTAQVKGVADVIAALPPGTIAGLLRTTADVLDGKPGGHALIIGEVDRW